MDSTLALVSVDIQNISRIRAAWLSPIDIHNLSCTRPSVAVYQAASHSPGIHRAKPVFQLIFGLSRRTRALWLATRLFSHSPSVHRAKPACLKGESLEA